MEKPTAKIDVQKLQLLNDRICQTIDALNQVRLSMHRFSYGYGQTLPTYAMNSGLGSQALYGTPFYGSPVIGSPVHGVPGVFGGHNPYAFSGFGAPIMPWQQTSAPFFGATPSAVAYQGWNQSPVNTTGFAPVHATAPLSAVNPVF